MTKIRNVEIFLDENLYCQKFPELQYIGNTYFVHKHFLMLFSPNQCPMVVVGSKSDLEEERTQEAIYPAPWARAHNSKSQLVI